MQGLKLGKKNNFKFVAGEKKCVGRSPGENKYFDRGM